MKMKVRPVKADLQDGVKIGQGAIGSYEKAPPEHRVNRAGMFLHVGRNKHGSNRPDVINVIF